MASPDPLDSKPPTSIEPYKILNLPNTATASEIKSAYKKLALHLHPDKAAPENRESAHKAFQNLAFAYAVLSDERRRRRYDATGSTAESLDVADADFNWADFFRAQYAELVTAERIEGVKTSYQGSEEERSDVLRHYARCKGSMNKLYGEVMLSNPLDDEERFKGYVDEAIEKGEVEAFEAYTGESEKSKQNRMKKAKREAAEAEKLSKEVGKKNGATRKGKGGDLADLAALIQQRNPSKATTCLDDLETRYAGGGGSGKKGKKRKIMEEPSEEAFAEVGRRKKTVTEEEREGIEEEVEQPERSKVKSKRASKKA